MRIFISYSSRNRSEIEQLASYVKSLGHQVWYDHYLLGGQRWWDEILEHIKQCDILLFALSPDSLASKACTSERKYARELGKSMLPVEVAGNINKGHLPQEIAEIQIVDFRNPANLGQRHALRRALLKLNPAGPLPAPLPTPPSAPISPLNDFQQTISDAAKLSFDTQKSLVQQLQWYLQRDDLAEVDRARNLLVTLQKRHDVNQAVVKMIDELLDDSIGHRARLLDMVHAQLDPKEPPTPEDTQLHALPLRRRILYVAAPKRVPANAPTELWVKLALPTSRRFEDELAQVSRSYMEPLPLQTAQREINLLFPDNDANSATNIQFEVVNYGFASPQPQQEVHILPDQDSSLLSFLLHSEYPTPKGKLHVTAKQVMADGSLISVGTLSLTVEILSAEDETSTRAPTAPITRKEFPTIPERIPHRRRWPWAMGAAAIVVFLLGIVLAIVATREDEDSGAGARSVASDTPAMTSSVFDARATPSLQHTPDTTTTITPDIVTSPSPIPHIELVYTSDTFALFNIATSAKNISQLRFVGASQGVFRADEWREGTDTTVGSRIFALEPDQCFKIALTSAAIRNDICDSSQNGWLLRTATENNFWLANAGNRSFDVWRGDRRITTCVIADGTCTFSLP
ncbi:MAG: toll/interleukin-1 receptor domain-containing protein [Chloroflexi bacterium]|nr:toll/interleukin-1 receptor domain-containing protein [Chloroflexota bacterium]